MIRLAVLNFLGWTQEEIADMVGLTQGRIAQIINNSNFTKINNEIENFRKQGRDMGWVAEHYGLEVFPDIEKVLNLRM